MPAVIANLPKDVDVVVLGDLVFGRELVQGCQRIVFRVDRQRVAEESGHIGRISAADRQHELAVDLADAAVFDADPVLARVEIVDHFLHGLGFGARPFVPVADDNAVVRGGGHTIARGQNADEHDTAEQAGETANIAG